MRWIIRSIMALLLLVVLAIGAVFLIPSEKIADVAVQQFKTLTGRDLTITGSVRPSFWPQLGVKTGPISVANADWSQQGPMLQADALMLAVDMRALIGGEVKVTAIEATRPQIILERAADGQENWVFGGGGAAGEVTQDTPGVGAPFTIAQGLITNGTVTFIDHGAKTRFELGAIDAEVAIPDYRGPAQIELTAIRNGQSFSASVSVAVFQDFLDGRLGPLDLSLQAGAAEVAFVGQAGTQPLSAEGNLTADLADLTAISALAGIAAPRLPEGLGARAVSVKGALTLTEAKSVHLRGGSMVLDDNAIALDADLLTDQDVANLTAKMTAGALNLSGLTGGGAGGDTGGGGTATGWSQDPIDVSGLRAIDANVAISVESLDLGMIKLGPSQILTTIDRGRAVFDIRKVSAYGGAIAGNFVVNGRKGLSVGGDLRFADMDLQALSRDFAGYERLVGRGDLTLEFLGSGGSVGAIMNSLDGSGQLALGQGEILGLDIGGMLRTLDSSYVGQGQKTVFDSLTASFTMSDGLLRNDDLQLSSAYVSATGAGDLGLGARTIDYRIKATAKLTGDETDGITAPILIRGSWSDPSISLDLESLAQERLDEEAAKLEALAKEKEAQLRAEAEAKLDALEAEAKAKLEEELGAPLQEGETLQDGVKRLGQEVIEDEAAKALEKLLGGGG